MRTNGERKTEDLLRRKVEFSSDHSLDLLLGFRGIGCFGHISSRVSGMDVAGISILDFRAESKAKRDGRVYVGIVSGEKTEDNSGNVPKSTAVCTLQHG
jgi:hypothetical protein